MDTPKKPQASEEDEAPLVSSHSPSLQARSPFRPLPRRLRQAQVAEPPAAVERPSTSLVFDASPTTVAAALAKAGASPDKSALAWRRGQGSGPEVTVEIDAEEDDGAGTASS